MARLEAQKTQEVLGSMQRATHAAQDTPATSSRDSPSSRPHPWSCRSTLGSQRGDAPETPSRSRPLDGHWRRDRRSRGGVSLQGGGRERRTQLNRRNARKLRKGSAVQSQQSRDEKEHKVHERKFGTIYQKRFKSFHVLSVWASAAKHTNLNVGLMKWPPSLSPGFHTPEHLLLNARIISPTQTVYRSLLPLPRRTLHILLLYGALFVDFFFFFSPACLM